MTIIDETKATTTFKNGRIFFYAIDDQGKWEGHWVAETYKRHCSDKKHGSNRWGVAIFQFNDAYNSFKGTWDFCGDDVTYFWDGRNGPRNLDSALSEIFHGFQAANAGVTCSKYTASGVRRSSAL